MRVTLRLRTDTHPQQWIRVQSLVGERHPPGQACLVLRCCLDKPSRQPHSRVSFGARFEIPKALRLESAMAWWLALAPGYRQRRVRSKPLRLRHSRTPVSGAPPDLLSSKAPTIAEGAR